MIDMKAALEDELGDLSNVEDSGDNDENESIASDLYSISSYGVDLDVEVLVKRLKNKTYYVPDVSKKVRLDTNRCI